MSELVHWRDPRKTGVVFAVTLAYLICLAVFPFVSVLAYTGLVIILATLSFRLYKMIMAFINKTEQQNPFKPYLEKNLNVPQDRMHQQVDNVANHIQNLMVQLRRLFLVENVVDTLKFAVLLWALTYVGACLSVMALVIIAFVGLFTIPKFYETYKTQIDHYYDIIHSKAKQTSEMVQEKIPQLKKKTHAE